MGSKEPSLLDLLHNGRSVSEFWKEWLESSNPWRAAYYDGDDTLERRLVTFFVGFIALHVLMLTLKKYKLLGDVLASRPTLIANQLHCTSVSVLVVYLLWNGTGKESDYILWQHVGIPLSLAYFLGDIFWYCIPGRYSPISSTESFDVLIFFHHVTMLLCHYPVGSHAGAALCGAGSAMWSIKLSMLGYLCELSNPLMNYRWWLMQTLDKHRADFSVVVVLLVASFIARIFLLGWLILGYILPAAAAFIEAKQVFIYSLGVLGHLVILVLSYYWLSVLTKPGLKRMLIFTPPDRSAGAKKGFTFGSDMGRKKAE